MKRIRPLFQLSLGFAAFLASLGASAAAADPASANTAAMHALFDREYERDLRENPLDVLERTVHASIASRQQAHGVDPSHA